MINTVTGWFEISLYDNTRVMPITNLVETKWLARYPQ